MARRVAGVADLRRAAAHFRDVAAVEADQCATDYAVKARQAPEVITNGTGSYYPRRNLLEAARRARETADRWRAHAESIERRIAELEAS